MGVQSIISGIKSSLGNLSLDGVRSKISDVFKFLKKSDDANDRAGVDALGKEHLLLRNSGVWSTGFLPMMTPVTKFKIPENGFSSFDNCSSEEPSDNQDEVPEVNNNPVAEESSNSFILEKFVNIKNSFLALISDYMPAFLRKND